MGLCGASVCGRGRLSRNWHIRVLIICSLLPSFTQSGNIHHCPLNARLLMSTNDKCKDDAWRSIGGFSRGEAQFSVHFVSILLADL